MSTSWRLAAGTFLALSVWFGHVHGTRADDPKSAAQAEAYRRHGLDPATLLGSRVKGTPAYVLDLFKDLGGPAPTNHALTDADRLSLKAAIDALPPLHRRVLTERLRVISFLDGMPNTALTSTVNHDEPHKLFDITINASILRQNASEWLSQKEQSCFDASSSPLRVTIDAGTKLPALVYVFLHEATHVLDASLRITPAAPPADAPAQIADKPGFGFTNGVWTQLTLPVPRFRDPYRGRIGFYTSGGKIPISEAPTVYESLRKTPFVSLYGSLNWFDDLAEYVTVYHLTEILKQPYRIVVRKDGAEVFVYEPMKSSLVRERIGEMKRFY